jgi:hypothetical protein
MTVTDIVFIIIIEHIDESVTDCGVPLLIVCVPFVVGKTLEP